MTEELTLPEKSDIRKKIMEEILDKGDFHFDGIEDEQKYGWNKGGDTLLLYLERNSDKFSDKFKVFMKVPCGSTAEREVNATYNFHKKILDKKNLEPILEDDPVLFHVNNRTYKGILIERAKYSLKDYFVQLRKKVQSNQLSVAERDDELCNIIFHVSNGLKKAHDTGTIHKDIKESNINLYKLGWGLGDFGFSTASSADKLEVSSGSCHQLPNYLDYELLRNYTITSDDFYFSCPTDIFSLGVVLYMGTDKENSAPHERFMYFKPKGEFSPEWVLSDIANSERSPKLKYFLSRMLGGRVPEGIRGSERLKYRYASVDELLSDAESWPNIKVYKNENPQYEIFLEQNETFIKLLNKEKNTIDKNKLITNQSIDNIVTGYISLENKYNHPGLKNSLNAQKKFLETCEEYNFVRYEQETMIDSLIKKIEESTGASKSIQQFLKDMLPFEEKMFLWGPPFTNVNRPASQRARYNYSETFNKETHYHREFNKLMAEHNK